MGHDGVIAIRLGKGQRFAAVASQALAQGVIPAFLMVGVTAFANSNHQLMSRKSERIGVPAVNHQLAVTIVGWQAVTQLGTGHLGAIPNGLGHDLARTAAHSRPQPPLKELLTDKTPSFVQFQHIVRLSRQQALAESR